MWQREVLSKVSSNSTLMMTPLSISLFSLHVLLLLQS